VTDNPISATRSVVLSALCRAQRQVSDYSAWRRLHTDEDASAIVEFTMILPILVMIMLGILTFGLALNNYLELTQAVNTAAREISVTRSFYATPGITYGSSSYTDPCALAFAVLKASAPTLNSANMTQTLVLNGTSYSTTSCAGADANLVSGDVAKLSVKYPYVAVTIDFPNPNTTYAGNFTASISDVVQ
jgi:Flp pilus assembly protein TadG